VNGSRSRAVTEARAERRRKPSSVIAALAFLALAFSVIVPPGLMTTSRDGGGALVICTGHGPLTIDRPDDHSTPAKSKPGAACPFAANITPPAPALFILATRLAAFDRIAAAPMGAASPGRGLAAPPPPAIGPPVLT
jgi:hypothetical protein